MKRISKRTLTLIVSVVLAATLIIGGTFAYLMSVSDPVVNTFTGNEIDVELDETTPGEYHIMPGTSEEKDPTVTVNATCPAYVFVEIEDNTQGLVTWAIANGWTQLPGYDNVYYREVDGEDSPYTFPVLQDDMVYYSSAITSQQIKDAVAAANGEDLTLTFTAYAIQKVPFNDPVKAWLAVKPETVDNADDLIDALESGKSVVLGADMNLSQQIEVTETAILDLNGHTISASTDIFNDDSWSLISVQGGGDLLITGSGAIQAKENDSYCIDVREGGKLTIEGNGAYVGNITSIYVHEGRADLRGGTYSVLQKDDGPNPDGFVINSLDENWTNGTNTILISGGSYVRFDPSNNAAEGPGTNFLAGGRTVTEDGGVYTVN